MNTDKQNARIVVYCGDSDDVDKVTLDGRPVDFDTVERLRRASPYRP